MPINLSGGGKPSAPSIKLLNPGDSAVVAVVDAEWVDSTDMQTGKPKLKDDGLTVRKQMRLTALYRGGTAKVGNRNDGYTDPEQGALVTVFLEGHRAGKWVDANKALGRDVQVGDLVRVVFDRTERAKTVGFNDLKVWDVSVKDNEDHALVAECEEAYHQRKAAPPIAVGATPSATNTTRPEPGEDPW